MVFLGFLYQLSIYQSTVKTKPIIKSNAFCDALENGCWMDDDFGVDDGTCVDEGPCVDDDVGVRNSSLLQ